MVLRLMNTDIANLQIESGQRAPFFQQKTPINNTEFHHRLLGAIDAKNRVTHDTRHSPHAGQEGRDAQHHKRHVPALGEGCKRAGGRNSLVSSAA